MTEDLFIEKLKHFKQNEKPEAVLVIADNPEFIKILVAWTNLEVEHNKELTKISGESDNEVWEWLWENAKFSLTDLKIMIVVSYSESTLENNMKPLLGNRVLYADGTINSFVQRYLRERVLKFFETKPKKPNR